MQDHNLDELTAQSTFLGIILKLFIRPAVTAVKIPGPMFLGSRWKGRSGETTQREHQEAEWCGGAARKGAKQASDGCRGAAGKKQEPSSCPG